MVTRNARATRGTCASLAALAALCIGVLSVSTAFAHNGEPPPPPPSRPMAPEAGVKLKIKEAPPPPRWSWIHWWEANRDRYLTVPSQDARSKQLDDPKAIETVRDEVAYALSQAIDGPGKNDSLVIESALALAKIRHSSALPTLKRAMDQTSSVRGRAPLLAAIGLLGTADAESALMAYKPSRADDEAAAMASMGLLGDVQPETLRRLRVATDASDPGIASAVCFALRQHHQKNNAAYYTGLLHSSESPWVASDALLALGRLKDRESMRVLESVLFADADAGQNVRAWQELNRSYGQSTDAANRGDTRDQYEKNYQQYRKAYERFQKLNPNAAKNDKGPEGRAAAVDGGEVVVGLERLPLGWLRSSAAIAMGEIDMPRAGESLLRFVAPVRGEEDEFVVAPKGFAIISLAAYPTDATRDQLITLLGKWDPAANKLALDVKRDSPLRGFAALALGLYSRPYDTAQGSADRPGFDRAIITLAERLEDEAEEQEVRTACALGLGLSQRTVVLPILQRASEAIHKRDRKRDLLIYGYLMLGRALAGDAGVIDPAGRFVQSADDTSPSGILARRAGVLALGLSRSSLAVPVLTQAWNLNYYVNREVIVAIRLLGGTGTAQPLLKRLRESKDPEERAYMAQALGELLAAEHPTALVRLTAQSNYTVHNEKLVPLQRLSNGFLYDYLIASFGDTW